MLNLRRPRVFLAAEKGGSGGKRRSAGKGRGKKGVAGKRKPENHGLQWDFGALKHQADELSALSKILIEFRKKNQGAVRVPPELVPVQKLRRKLLRELGPKILKYDVLTWVLNDFYKSHPPSTAIPPKFAEFKRQLDGLMAEFGFIRPSINAGLFEPYRGPQSKPVKPERPMRPIAGDRSIGQGVRKVITDSVCTTEKQQKPLPPARPKRMPMSDEDMRALDEHLDALSAKYLLEHITDDPVISEFRELFPDEFDAELKKAITITRGKPDR